MSEFLDGGKPNKKAHKASSDPNKLFICMEQKNGWCVISCVCVSEDLFGWATLLHMSQPLCTSTRDSIIQIKDAQ